MTMLTIRTRTQRPIRKWDDTPIGTEITGILHDFRVGPKGGTLADFDNDDGTDETLSIGHQLHEAFEKVSKPCWVSITYRGQVATKRGQTVKVFVAGDDPERTAAWLAQNPGARPFTTNGHGHDDEPPLRTDDERPVELDAEGDPIPF
jgi:hypothetical protein